jgi:hypothetical protein
MSIQIKPESSIVTGFSGLISAKFSALGKKFLGECPSKLANISESYLMRNFSVLSLNFE